MGGGYFRKEKILILFEFQAPAVACKCREIYNRAVNKEGKEGYGYGKEKA